MENIKKFLWPIEKEEHAFVIPMSLMMFCMLMNFSLLRAIKDSLVVPSLGAEVLSFLKFYIVLPSAVLFTLTYAKLLNHFSFQKVFGIIIASFIVIFFIIGFFLLPYYQDLHVSENSVEYIIRNYPHFKWIILICTKWIFVITYVFSELWSVVAINLLFWQIANNNVDKLAAKRIYPQFGLIGNFGLFFAGTILVVTSKMNSEILSLQILICFIIFSCICILLLKKKLLQRGIKHENATLTKLSMQESFKLIIKSKTLIQIAILVISYSLVINIIEGPWKAKIKQIYPNTCDYLCFMGKFNQWLGIVCVVFMIFGGVILRNTSWKFSAMVTPIALGLTGFLFFIFVVFGRNITILDPILTAVILGAMQNIISKSAKYSLFDSTKEMAYIPLDMELRTKGKAAVEVIGTKLGKSFGAFLQLSFFTIYPDIDFDEISKYLMVIFVLFIILWIKNVQELSKQMKD